MADRFQAAALDALIAPLAKLRDAILAAARRHAADIERVPTARHRSAENLVHYVALRHFDLRALQHRLATLGLSSLGRCESNVLANLDAVLTALHRLAERLWDLDGPPTNPSPESDEQLERNAVELLGPPREGRGVRIMVTMSAEAADDLEFTRKLIHAGMDIARINSAHDQPSVWERIATNVRAAAAAEGTSCRILFDLSGPKLRTGAFPDGGRVKRVKPRRDELGLVVEPGRTRLAARGTTDREIACESVEGALFDQARPTDVIEVDEPSLRIRRVVVERNEGGVLDVRCDKSVRFQTDRALRLVRDGAVIALGRVGELPPVTRSIRLRRGDELIVGRADLPPRDVPRAPDGRPLAAGRIPSTLGNALEQVKPGDRIWFDDGRIGGVVAETIDEGLRVRIEVAPARGARLGPDKGINLPDTQLGLPRPTPQDIQDLGFAVAHADMVGFSFVEQPADVLRLVELLESRGGSHLGIILKIETRRAFEALPRLILTGLRSPPLGVMVARGDLAVEVGFSRLAEVQEEILWLCEAAHVPVIWATQVLETLAKSGLPTRAEVSDAAMGVRAECVMLNKGPFIVDAVTLLDDVLHRMRAHHSKKRSMLRRLESFEA